MSTDQRSDRSDEEPHPTDDESHPSDDASHSPGDASHPTDEEQVETEWHFWLLGALLVGGGILVVLGPETWPPVGFGLVGLAVLGWVVKTVVERSVD